MGDLSTLMQSLGTLMGTLTVCLVTAPFLILALVFFFAWRRSASRADASQQWNAVPGTIGAASVEPRRSADSDGGYHTAYYPTVLYEYEVQGKRYVGQQITFGSQVGYGNANRAQQVVDRYAPGNRVQVYYDPTKPDQAVLERRVGTGGQLYLWVAVAILVLLCITVVPIMLLMGGMNALFNSFPF